MATRQAAPLTPAWLDDATSQQVFGVLLDTLSRPGTLGLLPGRALRAGWPTALIPALALADAEVNVAVLEALDETPWAAEVRRATGCRIVAPSEADLVLALRPPSPDEVAGMRRGIADHPEQGARLVLACCGVTALPADCLEDVARRPLPGIVVSMWGPGVAHFTLLAVEGVSAEVLEAVRRVNTAFPAGIDLHLVSPGGRLASLPRSTRIEVVGHAPWTA